MVLILMIEVNNPSRLRLLQERFPPADYLLCLNDARPPASTDTPHHPLDESEVWMNARTASLPALDHAYETRNTKQARYILDRFTQYEPIIYPPTQNRVAMHNLAHPIHRYLTLTEHQEIPTGGRLAKDIEAIYGRGAPQLAFLLEQFDIHAYINPRFRADIEGGLSELIIFLLAARNLTDTLPNPYLVLPSTEAQDRAQTTADGLHHGFDLNVIRQQDKRHIPVQVKTSTTRSAQYPAHILVVSVADLVCDNIASARALAEAMFFEISGAQNCDRQLIHTASQRLFTALDSY